MQGKGNAEGKMKEELEGNKVGKEVRNKERNDKTKKEMWKEN